MSNWRDGESSGRKRAQQRQQERELSGGSPNADRPKADWRKAGSTPSTSKRGAKDASWQHSTKKDPTAGSRFRHRMAVFFFGAISIALIVTLVIWWIYRPLPTNVLVVIDPEGGSSASFGTHSYATAASETFVAMQEGRPLEVQATDTGLLLDPEFSLKDYSRKQKLIAGGPGKDALIIFISAAGAVDENGEPYLIRFSDGKPGVTVANLMRNIKALKDLENNPIPFKLVVLDSRRIDPVISPELMLDEFPGAVEKVLDDPEFEGLHVLLSHSNGQRSWTSAELGRTVFAHYVASGLAGEADKNEDKAITLLELGAFVNQSVSTWVENRLAVTQTPVLIPPLDENSSLAARKLSFVNIKQARNVEAKSVVSQVTSRADQVQNRWVALERQASIEEIIRYQPYQLSRIEAILTRMETLVPETDSLEWKELDKRAEDLTSRISKSISTLKRPRNRVPVSLAEAVIAGDLPPLENGGMGSVDPELTAKLDQWIELHGPSDKPGEQEKARQTFRANLVGQQSNGQMYVSGEKLRWLVWQWLRTYGEDGPPQDILRDAVGLINDHNANLPTPFYPEWVEIKLIKFADRYIDWNNTDESLARKTVQKAMLIRQQSELVIFEMDRRAKYWVATDLDRIEERRRRADDLFLANRFAEALSEYEGLSTDYERLSNSAQTAADRLDLHERALHDIPWLMAWAAREYTLTDGEEAGFKKFQDQVTLLNEAMEHTHELGATLYKTLPTGDFATLNAANINELRTKLAAANKAYRDHCSDLIGRRVISLASLHNALMCPIADSQLRQDLRTQYKAQLDKAQTQGDLELKIVVEGWTESSINSYRSTVAGFFEGRDSTGALPFSDVESTVDIQVEQFVETIDRKDWSVAATQDGLLAAMQGLASKWLAEPSSDRRQQLNRLFGIGHFARLSAPYIVERMPVLIESEGSLSTTLDQASSLEKIHWDLENILLARRALEDFWGNGGDSDSRFYFDVVTSNFLDALTTDDQLKNDLLAILDSRRALAERMRRSGGRLWILGNELKIGRNNDGYEEFEFDLNIDEIGFPSGVMAVNLEQDSKPLPVVAVEEPSSPTIVKQQLPVENSRPLVESMKVGIPAQRLLNQNTFGVRLAYRGHEADRRFQAKLRTGPGESEPVVVKFIPEDPTEAKVTVNGGTLATADIVIVLDCSASMKDQITVGEGVKIKGSRLSFAKTLVKNLLGQLEEAGIYRVSLVAYGHRVKYEDDTGNSVFNEKYLGAKLKAFQRSGTRPNTDVEVIIPFPADGNGRPTDHDTFLKIKEEIDRLEPWGQTPLYLSLKEAADELDQPRVGGEAERQILVLSDGVDFPNPGFADDPKSTRIRDVASIDSKTNEVKGLSGNLAKTRVFMVLYDVKRTANGPSQKEIELGKKHLIGIAKESNGESLDSKDYQEIEAKLTEFVKRIEFTISPSRPGPDAVYRELNQTWQQVIRNPGRHLLSFNDERMPSQDLYLYGGERLVMDLEGKSLSFRVDPKIPTSTGVVNFNDVAHRIGLVDLRNNSKLEQFKFSVLFNQDRDLRFKHVDRPAQAILDVELVGRDLDKDEVNYRLYDFDFEPDLAYPLIRFPNVEIDRQSKYRLTLRINPAGARPLKDQLELPALDISQDKDDPTVRMVNDVRLEIYRGQNEITVNASASDAAKLKDLMIVCPQSDIIRREYYPPENKRAMFRFTVSQTAMENGSVQLNGFLIEDMFFDRNGTQELQFSYP